MFDNLKGFASIMKNAGQLREKADQLKAELEHKTAEGESGGGAVRVTFNGHGKVLRVTLDQPLLLGIAGDDKTVVEELIASAINDGAEKLKRMVGEEVKKIAGGLDLPGLSDILSGAK